LAAGDVFVRQKKAANDKKKKMMKKLEHKALGWGEPPAPHTARHAFACVALHGMHLYA